MYDINNEPKKDENENKEETENNTSQNSYQANNGFDRENQNRQYPPGGQDPYAQNPYNQNPYYQNPYNGQSFGGYGQFPPNYGQPYGYYPPNYYRPYNGYPYGGYPYGYPPQGNGYPWGNYVSPEEMQARHERKTKLRRLGNGIGIPLCLFSLISYVITQIFVFVVTIAVGDQTAVSIFRDPNVNYLLSAGISILCFTLPFLITSKFTGLKWKDTLSFKRTSSTKFLSVIMLGLGACALSNYASSMISAFMLGLTGKGSQTSMIEFGTDWKSFVISLLCVGILPALLEEFAFRGIVLGSLHKYMNDGTAIFVSAALFGLLHGNLQQIPFAFGVGLALGYATVYCNSIVPALVLHGINNSLAVVLDFATRTMNPLTSQVTTMLYLAVLLLIGVCGFIMLVLTDKDAFHLSKTNSDSSSRDIKQISSSAAMIVFFVLTGLSVFITQFM